MKNTNLRRRIATLTASLLPFLTKAVEGLLIIVAVVLVCAGGWYVYHVITQSFPKILTPQDTNDVSIDVQYYYDGIPAFKPDTNSPKDGAFFLQSIPRAFSFQYGMCSTNPRPVVWTLPGTNLVGIDPFPSNNLTCPSAVLWTLSATNDNFDVIYYVRNVLYRSTLSNQISSDGNLAFVISKAVPPYSHWVPLYTNDLPLMDYPYTFTDPNATSPATLYRADWQ